MPSFARLIDTLVIAALFTHLSAVASAQETAPNAPSSPVGVDPVAGALSGNWARYDALLDLMEAGGSIMYVLAVVSVLVLGIVLVKFVQFMALRAGDGSFIERAAELVKRGELTTALDMVARRRGVVARVMESALRGRVLGLEEGKIREEVERVARVKLDGLEAGLPALSTLTSVSPLLGLLGTVTGMIGAFQALENAGSRVDPAILSSGIWEALLTTAFGLIIAIPASAAYAWLQRSVDLSGHYMENAATRAFTADLYREGGAGAGEKRAA